MSTNSTNQILSLTFKVDSFRKIPNPYLRSDNKAEREPEMYVMICDVMDLPDNIPMDTNPRKQSLKTEVSKAVIKSLVEPADQHNFYLLNRGLLISAESVSYNSESSTVTMVFSNFAVHGDIDGGHTYEIIKENRKDENGEDRFEHGFQYVMIEAMTHVEDMFEQLAKARNYSVKVQDKSIANLAGEFDLIRKAISNESYAEDVGYMENEDKRIDILDLVSLFSMFNIEQFPNDPNGSYPVVAYNSKAGCLKSYRKYYEEFGNSSDNPFVKMMPIMAGIVKLYDYLEVNIGRYYRNNTPNKKYGAVSGVAVVKDGKPKFRSRFLETEMDYLSPNGFLYPIIGSFRAWVELNEKGTEYRWIKNINPVDILEKYGIQQVLDTVDASRDLGNNPNATGKSLPLWKSLYKTMFVEALMAKMS